MTMTDEEILSAAARLRAARRRRIAKLCEVCGTPFEGIAQRRYCSDACRMRASRARRGGAEMTRKPKSEISRAPRGKDESSVDYLGRVRDYLSRGRVFDDSVELIRRSRMERTLELERAMGMSEEELARERAEWEQAEGWAPEERPQQTREGTMHDRIPTGNVTGAVADAAHQFPEVHPAGAAAEPPRGDDESLVAYLGRIRDANMRAGSFTESTTETVRRERDRLDETVDPDEAFPTRYENESAVAYFRRLRAYNGRNGVFTDDSTELLRQSREERSAELLRAAGLEPSDEA